MNLADAHLLISRTDNLGDVALTLPLAGYLRSRFPKMKISFLCRAYAAPMVRYCDAIDEVVELESVPDLQRHFRDSKVDVVVFARPDKRLAWAARKAGVEIRVGTSHRWFHWLSCNRLAHFSRAKSSLHEAQLNFRLLGALGIDAVPKISDIPPLYRLRVPAYAQFLELNPQHFNVIIHPKSNGNGREWPVAHYTALARLFLQRPETQFWVTGTQSEGSRIDEAQPDLFRLPNVHNVCGLLNLDELVRFIAAADGLVASGTGPLHIAAAIGRPTVGLFPPIRPIDPKRWRPIGQSAQTLCTTDACKQCTGASACPCMQSIQPSQVADVLMHWQADKESAGGDRPNL